LIARVFYRCINPKGREDECEAASEVYQCGRDENLPIMDQIYTVEKRDATVVFFFVIFRPQIFELLSLKHSPPVPCIASAWRACKMNDLPCVINVDIDIIVKLLFLCTKKYFKQTRLDIVTQTNKSKI